MTDGKNKLTCVYLAEDVKQKRSRKESLSLKCPPGSKLLVQGRLESWSGVLFLNEGNCKFVGGHVEELVRRWEERKKSKTVKTIL